MKNLKICPPTPAALASYERGKNGFYQYMTRRTHGRRGSLPPLSLFPTEFIQISNKYPHLLPRRRTSIHSHHSAVQYELGGLDDRHHVDAHLSVFNPHLVDILNDLLNNHLANKCILTIYNLNSTFFFFFF